MSGFSHKIIFFFHQTLIYHVEFCCALSNFICIARYLYAHKIPLQFCTILSHSKNNKKSTTVSLFYKYCPGFTSDTFVIILLSTFVHALICILVYGLIVHKIFEFHYCLLEVFPFYLLLSFIRFIYLNCWNAYVFTYFMGMH